MAEKKRRNRIGRRLLIQGDNFCRHIKALSNIIIKGNNDSVDMFSGKDILIENNNDSYDITAKGDIVINGNNDSQKITTDGNVIIYGDFLKGTIIANIVIVEGNTYIGTEIKAKTFNVKGKLNVAHELE